MSVMVSDGCPWGYKRVLAVVRKSFRGPLLKNHRMLMLRLPVPRWAQTCANFSPRAQNYLYVCFRSCLRPTFDVWLDCADV